MKIAGARYSNSKKAAASTRSLIFEEKFVSEKSLSPRPVKSNRRTHIQTSVRDLLMFATALMFCEQVKQWAKRANALGVAESGTSRRAASCCPSLFGNVIRVDCIFTSCFAG